LHLPASLRQHLGERLLEKGLAQGAAQLRRLQELFESGHVSGELLDLPGGLVDPAHLLPDLLQQAPRLAQVLGQALLPVREAPLHAPHPLLDGATELFQTPVQGLRGLPRGARLGEDPVEARRGAPEAPQQRRQNDGDESGHSGHGQRETRGGHSSMMTPRADR